YYIDTPPWAGGEAIPMNGAFNSPTVAVDATINTGMLSIGRHVIFVRGRGLSDFQGFQTWGPISAAFLDVTGGSTPTPTATASPAPPAAPPPKPPTAPPPETVPPTATATSTTTPTATPRPSPTARPTAIPRVRPTPAPRP